MLNQVITIDGPAASGKSTLARLLAEHLGCQLVESGMYYRYLTWKFLKQGEDAADSSKVAAWMGRFKTFWEATGQQAWPDEVAPEWLRELRVSQAVPLISAVPEARELVTEKLRQFGHNADCVVEGRDIGTVVFPDSSFKFYLSVPLELREQRRRGEGSAENINARDEADRSRKIAPLAAAPDACLLEAGGQSPMELRDAVTSVLTEKGYRFGPGCPAARRGTFVL